MKRMWAGFGLLLALPAVVIAQWGSPCTGVITTRIPDVAIYGAFADSDSTFVVYAPNEVLGDSTGYGADFAIPVYFASTLAAMQNMRIILEYDDTAFNYAGYAVGDSVSVFGEGHAVPDSAWEHSAWDSVTYLPVDSVMAHFSVFLPTRTCTPTVNEIPYQAPTCVVSDTATAKGQEHLLGRVQFSWACTDTAWGGGASEAILFHVLFNAPGYTTRDWFGWDQTFNFTISCARTDNAGNLTSWLDGYNYNVDNDCSARVGDYQWTIQSGSWIFDKKGESFTVGSDTLGNVWCGADSLGRECLPIVETPGRPSTWAPEYCTIDTICDYQP